MTSIFSSGDLAPLYVGVVSFLITRDIIIPNENNDNFFKLIIGDWLSPYYEPARDSTANMMMMGAILGYVIMAGSVSVLDLIPLESWKTQGRKSYFTLSTWLKVVATCLFNMFICSWTVVTPVWVAHRTGVFRNYSPLTTESAPIDPVECIKNFAIHMIVIDVWFYSTHKLLHYGPLFSWIHKMHHTYHAPTAVACMYAHPVEYCIGNVLGVILGPCLTNCHPYECAFWMTYSLASTSASHSGYFFLGATDHDAHHEHFYCNYGVGVFMDKLFKTEYEGSDLQKKVNRRIGAHTPQ